MVKVSKRFSDLLYQNNIINMKIMTYLQYLAFLIFTEYVKIQTRANLVGWLYDSQTHFPTKRRLWGTKINNENRSIFPTCKLMNLFESNLRFN